MMILEPTLSLPTTADPGSDQDFLFRKVFEILGHV
jgi:hypothetical protein